MGLVDNILKEFEKTGKPVILEDLNLDTVDGRIALRYGKNLSPEDIARIVAGEEYVDFEGQKLAKSEAEELKRVGFESVDDSRKSISEDKSAGSGWNYEYSYGKRTPAWADKGYQVIEDGHVVEIMSNKFIFGGPSLQEKFPHLRKVRVTLDYESEKPAFWEDNTPIARALEALNISPNPEARVRFTKKTDIYNPQTKTTRVSVGGTFEANSAIPSNEAAAALVDYSILHNDYALWRLIRNKLVPEREAVNDSPFGLDGNSRPALEAVKRAAEYFHKDRVVDFFGHKVVRKEYDILHKYVIHNCVGALDKVFPEAGDIIVEDGHVVELRMDKLLYGGFPAEGFKKSLPHLRRIRVNTNYEIDQCSSSHDNWSSSRKANEVDVDESRLRTVVTQRAGITFEYLTKLPTEEELEKAFVYILGKRELKDKNDQPYNPPKYIGSVTSVAWPLHNEFMVTALVQEAIKNGNPDAWRIVEAHIVPPEERLDGEIVGKGGGGGGSNGFIEPPLVMLEGKLKEAEERFDYHINRESIASWLEQTFPGLPGHKLEEYLGQISEEIKILSRYKGGWASNSVIKLGDTVVKIDKPLSAAHEHKILSLDLGEFSQYAPRALTEPSSIGEFSLWTMNDLSAETPGWEISGIEDHMEHYMDVIGLLHRDATKAVVDNGVPLPVGHFKYDGFTYTQGIEATYAMLSKINGEQRLIKELCSPLEDTLKYAAERGDTVIHGDLKMKAPDGSMLDFGSNVKNGYILDFGRVRWGRIAEDLARAFVGANLNDKQIMHYTNKYIEHRCKNDSVFEADVKKQMEIYSDMPQMVRKERLKYATTLRRRVGVIRPDKVLKTANQLVYGAYEGLQEERRESVKIAV